MKNLRAIVGENLTELRKSHHLTQYELAEKMNYSDKSISKWENGDTLPDLETLNDLCIFYGVTLDYLTHPIGENKDKFVITSKRDFINKIMIISLICSMIWMLATIVFVYSLMHGDSFWIAYIYAIPTTCLISSLYIKKHFVTSRLPYFIIWTIFVWSTITAVFLTFLLKDSLVWPLFIIGVPAEVSLGLWAFIKK